MKIYLAGPMRGIELFNFPAFDRAAADLRDCWGHDVFSPAERDRDEGFDPAGTLDGFDLHAAMRDDLRYIIDEADAIALLPGWETSTGARLERAVAEATGKKVMLVHFATESGSILSREHEQRHMEVVIVHDGETAVQEAQRLVHGNRGDDYGHPGDDMARTGRIWGAILDCDDVPPETVALCMVAIKMSREVNRPKRDNRVDGAGYFECIDMIHERREAAR